jgi:hypothetical protein
MREHEKELEMVADEWRDEVGEARAQVEELKDVSHLCFSGCIFVCTEEQRAMGIRDAPEEGERAAGYEPEDRRKRSHQGTERIGDESRRETRRLISGTREPRARPQGTP